MLTENQIDKLIQPLINRQTQIEISVLSVIAERLKDIQTMTPSDIYKLERLLKSGSDVRKINAQISKLSGLSENEIKKIIKEVAKDAYKDAKPFYDYRHKSYISFEKNKQLQATVKAIEKATLGEYKNLSNTTAFMLRDINNPLIIRPTSLSKAYNKLIDMAIQTVAGGFDSYNVVIPNIVQNLIDKGITSVEYIDENGVKRYKRLDAAVKQTILNGVRDINQQVQNVVGEQFGANGVELSVHQYSAPDHEPIQGHQFTMEEFNKLQTGQDFEDINGVKFKSIDRPIGMWNCRHFAWNIVIGHKTPNYTPEQLENLKQVNSNGITVKDKHGKAVKKSMYWCTQRRNKYELDIKKAKEGIEISKKAGQSNLQDKYQQRHDKLQKQYANFCKKCGLQPRWENTRIFV